MINIFNKYIFSKQKLLLIYQVSQLCNQNLYFHKKINKLTKIFSNQYIFNFCFYFLFYYYFPPIYYHLIYIKQQIKFIVHNLQSKNQILIFYFFNSIQKQMQNLQNMNMESIQNMQNMPIQNMQSLQQNNMPQLNNLQNNMQNIQNMALQNDDLQNSDWSESNASNQPVSGKCNFICGVKNCNTQFKGKKKDHAKEEFLKHFKTIHQDFLANPKYEDDKQIMKTYLKKQQKLNYYCKLCQQQGEDQRFSQVNNVKDRSGLEPHVKHKHPEMFTDPEQILLQQQSDNKWRQQWCGYSGPKKTTVGRPNNNYIPMKYGQDQQDIQEDDNQITQEDVDFYASIGIDVRKNRSIDTMEYRQYLEIIENLYRQKDIIEKKQREMIQQGKTNNTKEIFIGQQLGQYLNETSQERFSNLSYLILNQKTPDLKKPEVGLYPEGCQDSMGLIVESCVKKIKQDILQIKQNFTSDDLFVYENFSQVSQLFINFYNDLIQMQQQLNFQQQ